MKKIIIELLSRSKLFKRLSLSAFPDSLAYAVSSLNKNQSRLKRLESRGYQSLPSNFGIKRSSDTIFILGSGSSINEMTDGDFSLISKHDSIGFNLWLIHPFVPSFYVFQSTKSKYQGTLLSLMEKRAGDYSKTEIIVRGDSAPDDDSDIKEIFRLRFGREPIWHLSEFPINSSLRVEISELVQFLKNLDLWGREELSPKIPKFAGTAGLIISLCYQMGYQNIVLCGVDMNDSPHFYNSRRYEDLFPNLDLPPLAPSKLVKSGFFKDQKRWIIDLSKALAAEGVAVSLFSKRSTLAEHLPLWPKPQA